MTGFLGNIDCLVLEVYKYKRTSTFPSLDLIQMALIACISLGEIWFYNNLEGKWVLYKLLALLVCQIYIKLVQLERFHQFWFLQCIGYPH